MQLHHTFTAAVAASIVTSAATAGIILPAAESFDAGAANWYDAGGGDVADWVASGGADGGGYLTGAIDVPAEAPPFGLTAFRAQDEFGSSGGIFEGDWFSAGVTEVRFSIRHDGPGTLNVFARMASPDNFPSAVGLSFIPIAPGVWTDVAIDVTEDSPALVLGGSTYADIFSNVGHLQVGFQPSDALLGQTVQIDLDAVSVVPTPAAAALLGLAGLVGTRRRR